MSLSSFPPHAVILAVPPAHELAVPVVEALHPFPASLSTGERAVLQAVRACPRRPYESHRLVHTNLTLKDVTSLSDHDL